MTKKEQTEQENLTPQELKAQADAILAADQAEKEQREKARNTPLDEKTIATLPAAALITANEKLRDLLAKGKKKGKLDSGELMETLDDLNLESEQMDQVYDSLEALSIDISNDEDILPDLADEEPAAEEIAEVEEEELVDPNSLVNSFSIDDPVRMYLKEIGKVPPAEPGRGDRLGPGHVRRQRGQGQAGRAGGAAQERRDPGHHPRGGPAPQGL